jgi:hypothetical protein
MRKDQQMEKENVRSGSSPMTNTPSSADVIEGMREAERDAFAYAVWMVGNIDTVEDKAAWWADFRELWELAANRVTAMHKRGVTVGQGFDQTGLRSALALPDSMPDGGGLD